MADDKKARLDAIRAANRARQEQSGDATAAEPAAAAAPAATQAPAAAAPVAQAAVGASMADDKKARLEAIRAANAAKKAEAGAAPAVAAPAATQAAPAAAAQAAPAAAAPAAAAPKPAARPAPQTEPIADDRIPMGVLLRRVIIGAVAGLVLCLLLATITGNFVQGAIWGIFMGAVFGPLILGWPPRHTTSD